MIHFLLNTLIILTLTALLILATGAYLGSIVGGGA